MTAQPALPLPNPYALDAAVCRVCGVVGCAVIALGRGAKERSYCTIACARTEGWPWLPSEPTPAPRRVRIAKRPFGNR